MVPDKQIETILSGPSDLKQKETALMDSALAAGGLDNITFQLVEITHSTSSGSCLIPPRWPSEGKYPPKNI
jgi:serine/threonine protein phosphatase PrpC